jgi:hypothetical protein
MGVLLLPNSSMWPPLHAKGAARLPNILSPGTITRLFDFVCLTESY